MAKFWAGRFFRERSRSLEQESIYECGSGESGDRGKTEMDRVETGGIAERLVGVMVGFFGIGG